ncbi:MAG: helix-turn-helix domain-containing protein [Tepidisphaera sp.]|nr:helix-turn-helix domain-containing protein [Tepidisphaera sp.]
MRRSAVDRNKPINPEVLTVGEAALKLGVCSKVLRQLAKQGKFPNAFTVNGFVRIPIRDVDAFKYANRVQTTGGAWSLLERTSKMCRRQGPRTPSGWSVARTATGGYD